jgi:hypothetical protein
VAAIAMFRTASTTSLVPAPMTVSQRKIMFS